MKNKMVYIIGVGIILLYIASLSFGEINHSSTIFVTIASIIGGIAIFIQLKRERDLMEAQFLMEYNNTFITNESFTQVQKLLEDYKKGLLDANAIKTFDRQVLINYLVYLEALAALINKEVLNFELIDNLFSYRYFIAMNNPVVQEIELIEDAEFYRGCYVLHKRWSKFKKKNEREIIMEDTSLELVKDYNDYASTKRRRTK